MFPESFTFSIADWVNGWVDSLVTNYGDVFRQISDTLLWAIVNLEGLLGDAVVLVDDAQPPFPRHADGGA